MYSEIDIGLIIAIGGAIVQRRISSEVTVAREGWRR
jgi:hypothetical protein